MLKNKTGVSWLGTLPGHCSVGGEKLHCAPLVFHVLFFPCYYFPLLFCPNKLYLNSQVLPFFLDSLSLPRGERGKGCGGVCCCWVIPQQPDPLLFHPRLGHQAPSLTLKQPHNVNERCTQSRAEQSRALPTKDIHCKNSSSGLPLCEPPSHCCRSVCLE